MQSKTINSYIFYISIIGLSFLIGIPQAINQWLHEDIFYKYFNKGETHWYYDLVIMALLLSTYFYSNRLDKQLKISPFVISIVVLYIIFLGNYRFSYNEYLTPIYFNPCNNWFKYFDALFLIPFIIIGAYYINYNSEDNIDSNCNKCDQSKDKCICKKDILNTKSKVEYFLNTIESDFNFYGIVGKWGVGKTFFLNLLKIKLKEEDQNNVIIEFSPWKFNTTDL